MTHRCLDCWSFVGGGGGGIEGGRGGAGNDGGELVDNEEVEERVEDELLVLDRVDNLVLLN